MDSSRTGEPLAGAPGVLVTGCSTGIGRATALALVRAGLPTWASARQLDSIADLEAAGCRTVRLDVTDEASRRDAVAAVVAANGALGALVNNAGYAEMGALEEITPDRLRRQFDTNLFGVVRLCQLALPGMRARRAGTIVNVGSLVGKVSIPGQGAYNMSKHALESFTDTLRLEVRRFGVRVTLVAPQGVRTAFAGSGKPLPPVDESSPYAQLMHSVEQTAAEVFKPGAAGALEPEQVAQVILRAITSPRPKTRYAVGGLSQTMPTVRHLLPTRAWEAIIARRFALDKD